jgi:secreted protein with Ig-like and vWFA domain
MSTAIAGISEGGSTNLMAGWLLGRDELLKFGAECDKKILVLTDGYLNQGIIQPDTVEALTRSGFGKDGIRTSCLGFGDSYNEEILLAMSGVGHGQRMTPIPLTNSQRSWLMNWTGFRKSRPRMSGSGLSRSFSVIPGHITAITRQSRFRMAG